MAAEAKIKFVGDSTSAVAATRRLKMEMGELHSLAAKSFAFGGMLTGGAVVVGLTAITKSAVDTGDALYKMSQKTGTTVEELTKLNYASGLSGVSTEALQKGMTSLSVGMIEAADGAGISGAAIKKLGLNVRDADGKMKSSAALLYELADRFAAMPDGVEKTNLAVDIFGKRLGDEMIPLLNVGSAGLKEMGDEAERLGLVMSTELARKSEEFNDNLARLGTLSEAAGISLAKALIPALNALLTEYLDAGKAGLTFWESITGIGLSDPTKGPAEQIARITAEIEKLKKAAATSGWEAEMFGSGASGAMGDQIARLEKLRKYYELQQKRETGDGVANAEELAAKRVSIERQLQAKLADLAKLKGIAEGKVSADILLDDTKRTDAQIKNAEKLRATLTGMWEQSLKAAAAAGDEARKLFEQAADLRTAGADKAGAKRRATLSPEDQQAEILKQYGELSQSASQSASLAQIAAFNGRAENAAKLAAQAAKDADRAAKLADQIDDPELAARAIEEVTEIQARLVESQAKAKQKEQADFEAQAKAQRELIAGLDKQLADLQEKAATLKVQANIDEARGAIATLQAQLDNLQDKTITVTVNQVGSVPALGDAPMSSGWGNEEGARPFAVGGWTGPGPKYKIAGVVHADEFVTRSEIVRQPGALAFLSRFNQLGMSALRNLPGYANGGLVSSIRLPSLAPAAAPSTSPVILQWPDGTSTPLQGSADVVGEMKTAFARAALKRGGRR